MRALGFTVLAGVLLAVAPAPAPAQNDPWASQTFLSDYSRLKPSPSKTGQDYTYFAQDAEPRFATFDSVMVDQPEIAVSPDSPYHSAKPDDLKAISEFMRGTIVDRLRQRGYAVVEAPGERVLYLRVALTDLQLKKKRRGVLAYTPVGAIVHGVKGAVQEVMENVDILAMAGQAEVADSRTGEVFGAMVTRRGGTAGGPDKKVERMTFDDFKAHVEEYSDRMACRLDNARRPAEQRVDCTDPAVRKPA